ncbi:N,N-dimethylformamidase beta subunit family domain-containing protein [Zavarzinia sp. CC-PAN008]|uniref:N,N-dimethylformamidase beta subunit family domain-containing protein n=1 Tax=Zavarzinia sp. CC-PAN008 TaxID=3243332 RepID=UPI003F74694D
MNTPTTWAWAYSDRLSARPGETVALHAAGTGGTASLEVARVGRERTIVLSQGGITLAPHAVPEQVHVVGCDWPVVAEIAVGDWPSGYYDIVLTAADGTRARHMLCVRATAPRARAVLVLSTNTYHAYNSWGGANTYAWIGGPHPVPVPADAALHRVAARLSTRRPFSAGILKPASPLHRLANPDRRGFMERAQAGELRHEAKAGGLGWDAPAGFLDKWEHAFVAWAEEAGYALDYLTDADVERAGTLDGYAVALFVGHSEYWSWPQRMEVERFVDGGGRAVILSGNTCYWQCRFENDGATFVAHKARAEDEDPVAADPARRHLTSGLWSSPWIAKPEAELTGLSFLFGGYHRFGNCVARGAGGYTVWRPEHWALAGSDLEYGDLFGDECRLVGYENDGCPLTFGEDGLPQPVPRLGVPANLEIIATAPATLFERGASPYSGAVPPEAPQNLARALTGRDGPDVRARLVRGHAVLACFERGQGSVFNFGTTEWAYGLAAGNPFVDRITRNVLDRFGAR